MNPTFVIGLVVFLWFLLPAAALLFTDDLVVFGLMKKISREINYKFYYRYYRYDDHPLIGLFIALLILFGLYKIFYMLISVL